MGDEKQDFIKAFEAATTAEADARSEREEFIAEISRFIVSHMKYSNIKPMDVATALSTVAQNVYQTFHTMQPALQPAGNMLMQGSSST